MELLLEAGNSDLKEIECELASIKEQIEDTNDFINIHLNTIRNRIIQTSLYMDMGTVALATGGLTAGIFGMNLTSGIESHETAFYLATGGIAFSALSIFTVFAKRFSRLNRDYTTAKSYHGLKHFFDHIEDVEEELHKRGLDKEDFQKYLEPAIGTQFTEDELNNIFKKLDENRDGVLDIKELTEFEPQSTEDIKHVS